MQREQLSKLLQTADEGGYAIPSFNYTDIWDFLAIVRAAEAERAPILIAANQIVAGDISLEICAAIAKAAAAKASVPLVHHLDHCTSVEMCKKAIDCGFESVMIDASKHDLDENIRLVSEVVEYAHARDVSVEAETGRIRGKNIEGEYVSGAYLAEVPDAVELAEASGADSLAVGIGTAHGFYEGKPEINFKRLAEINEAVSIPLVLHGGTGIPEEDIRKAIKNGINKINVGTIIYCTYMNGMRAELIRLGDNQCVIDVVKPVLDEIEAVVRRWIRVCMADGKA